VPHGPPDPSASSGEEQGAPRAWAREDLVRALTEALASEGHLLAAGEQHIARSWLALPLPAASLYARLHGRRGAVFRLDELRYAEVPDVAAAADELVRAGFAWHGAQLLPARLLATTLTVVELRAACRQLGRATGGRREELRERLADPAARAALVRPSLLLRHEGLFARLARLFLGSRDGDLTRLLLARLEVVRYPAYAPTGGLGLFVDRRDLLAWEEGLARDAALGVLPAAEAQQALLAGRAEDLERVEGSPAPPPWRARSSARRLAAARVAWAGRELERLGEPALAVETYARLLAAGGVEPGELVQRQALALAALGRGAEGAALCQAWVDQVSPSSRVAVARTGRRLARASGTGWAPPPPLCSPRTRSLELALAATGGARPTWHSPDGPLPLEAALVSQLAQAGRVAIHAEGLLWRTLFGLLFAEALFAPVPGMLPTPLRTRPLDLGEEGFVPRRQALVDGILAALRAGEAPDRLAVAWAAREGEAIAGVAWRAFPLPLLQQVAHDLGGPALAAVLHTVAWDWRAAPRGLPDLVVLAGPALRLDHSRPARLPAHVLLAEVKGPGDQLRDAQHAWLDRLLSHGVPTELWRIRPLPASPDQG